jgi:hypothetical protein
MGPRFNVFLAFSALTVGCGWFIGCGTGQVVPVTGPIDPSTLPSETGNTPPQIFVIEPSTSITLDDRDTFTIVWRDTDPDTNALVTGKLDPDFTTDNGNEITIFSNVSEDNDDPDGLDRFVLNTSGLAAGTYFVVLEIFDEINPRVTARSAASIRIVPAGLSPGNAPPKITVTTPTLNLGVGQEDRLVIEWIDTDPDSNATLYIVADLNNDPNDDNVLDPNDPGIVLLGLRTEDADPAPFNPEDVGLVGGGVVGGVTVIPGETPPPLFDADGDMDIDELDEAAFCAQPNRLCVIIDINQLPVRPTGDPYFIRITADDQVNPQVHAYAPGSIRVLTFETGVVDLGQVGRTITGAVFQGFNEGANVGSEFAAFGDWDVDGTNDAMIVAQFGSGIGRIRVGQAFLLYGTPGLRLSGITNINEIGGSIRGTVFTGGGSGFTLGGLGEDKGTMGITSVDVVPDVTGDGRPEILFGQPFLSGQNDFVIVDPQGKSDPGDCILTSTGCGIGIYGDDGLPEPDSIDGNFILGRFGCDPNLGVNDFFDSGYAFFMSSNPRGLETFNNIAVDLQLLGQFNSDGDGSISAAKGTRWRGSYHDLVLTTKLGPSFSDQAVTRDTLFGRTVASLPDMTTLGLRAGRFKDGFNEILISAPRGLRSDLESGVEINRLLSSNATDRPGKIFFQNGTTNDDSREGDGEGTVDAYENSGNISSIPTFSSLGDCSRSPDYDVFLIIVGEANGDEFGWGVSAGDFNRDGSPDILCGAPGANRDGKIDSGILYVLFGSLTIGNIDLSIKNQAPPRLELHGDDGDRLGGGELLNADDPRNTNGVRRGNAHALIQDFNGGSNDDIVFGIPLHDSDGIEDSGLVGIILGDRLITGENIFNLSQLATNELPGVIIQGVNPNDRFGDSVASAGDYNGDGLGDIVVTAPNEIRFVNGQERRGVVYIVFGNSDAVNRRFFSTQIGTEILPGVAFVSPYEVGSLDEAAPEMAKGAGDLDGDGFDDVMIGNPDADFVDPASPGQRRNDAGEFYLIYGNGLD